MKQFLLSLGCLISMAASLSYGQAISSTDQSAPANCDGTAIFTQASSYTSFFGWSWRWTQDSDSSLLQTGGDTITGLCSGNYTFHLDSAGSELYTENFIIGNGDPCNGLTIYATVTNADSNACNGAIVPSIMGGSAPFTYAWSTGETTYSISDLCPGIYELYVVDMMGCNASQVFTLSQDSVNDPCNNFIILNGGVTNTSPNGCLGTITPNIYGGTAPYTIYFQNDSTTGSTIYGLCPGNMQVEVIDANGCSAIYVYGIMIDSIALPLIDINLDLANDSTGLCTGMAVVNPQGGTAPYYTFWSTGESGDFIDSLCAGIYSVMVYDSNGDTTMMSFAITDPGSTYGNDPYGDSNVVDNIYFDLVENCIIDYANIDSASLYAAVLDSVSQNLYVTWAIYSPADTVYISDTIGFNGGNGVYNLTISVFCPQKSLGNYMTIVGQIYIQNNVNVATVEESGLGQAIACPNPFNGEFTVTVGKADDYSVTLRDALGRTIQSNTFEQTNQFTVRPEQTIAAGNYFLTIESKNGSTVLKLIK